MLSLGGERAFICAIGRPEKVAGLCKAWATGLSDMFSPTRVLRLDSSETGVGRSTDTAGLGTCATRAEKVAGLCEAWATGLSDMFSPTRVLRLDSSETGVGRSTDTAGLGTCATRAVVSFRSELERWASVSDVVAQAPTTAASTLASTSRRPPVAARQARLLVPMSFFSALLD